MTTSQAIDECPPSPSTSSASASSCSLLSASDENNNMMRGNGGKGAGGEPRKSVAGLCLVILTPSLGGFLYGYDIGATSFVLSMLNAGAKALQDEGDGRDAAYAGYDDGGSSEGCYWWDDFSSRHFQMGIMVSAMSFGALVSSHLIYHCFGTRQMSRRMELRVAAALYVLGSLCNVLSGTVFAAAATAEETETEAELSGFRHHHHHHHQGGGSGSGDRYHDFGLDDPDGCAAADAGPGLGWYVIVLGRLLYGMGVGFVMHGAPTYLAEMSPSSIRGAVVSSKETVIVLGVTTGYALGNAVSSMISDGGQQQGQNRWTYLYGASLCLSVPMLVLSFCIPRSKRWLIMHGLYDEAEESMMFVYADHPDVVRGEFEKLSTSMRANQARYLYERQPCSTLADDDDDHRAANRLFSAPVRPALTAAMGLILFQQISGQPSVLSYAAVLFEAAGWGGHACTISAVVMLFVSSCTVALVDRLGRRRHLLTCVTAMSLAALTLAACFWDWAGPDDDSSPAEARDDDDDGVDDPSSSSLSPLVSVTVLLSMFLYIGGYQIGFGPITWLLVSEMFPGDVRGPATALGVELNYLLNFVVQFLVPVLQDRLGWGRTFALFGAVMIAAFGFVFHYVPETAGKTLEQIEEELLTHKHGVVGDDDRRKPAVPPTEATPFLPAVPGTTTETTASRAV